MLTNRQKKIIEFLLNNLGVFVTSSRLSSYCNVSERTIKSDIKAIKDKLDNNNRFRLISAPSKGYKLDYTHRVVNVSENVLNLNELDYSKDFNEPKSRIRILLKMLLSCGIYHSKRKMIDSVFVSESTFYSDLKIIKGILSNYKLDLLYNKSKGYYIVGEEINKRKCLIKENLIPNLNLSSNMFETDLETISIIRKKLLNILSDYKFKISDKLFEDLLIYLSLAEERIKMKNTINNEVFVDGNIDVEMEIARDIFNKCFNFPEELIYNEILYLALKLRGKRDYDDISYISNKIVDFVSNSFSKIKKEFGVDFSENLDLKVVISLHFVPLLHRVKYDMQLENILLPEIKRSFPFAFDMANYFRILVFEEFDVWINEDEVAYLTLYFNFGLENVVLESKGKKVLIISRLKRSETIILRQRILQWFKNQITKIDIIPPRELSKTDIKSYDTIFTTEEVTDSMSGAFVPISLFPTDQDYSRMNIAINGFKSVDSIMELFDSELFFYGDVKDKNEVINKLIKLAKLKYNLPNKFDELIYSRENMSSTYFGSKIAMPHTLYPITQNTFIVVGLLANEIFWDDDHKVKLVLLVSTEINNPKAFQVWASLSHLVSDEALSDKLTNATSFNDITLIIKNRLKNFL